MPVWETVCLTCVLVLLNRSRVLPENSIMASGDILMCAGYFLAPLSFFALAVLGAAQIRRKSLVRILACLFIALTGFSILMEGVSFLGAWTRGTAFISVVQIMRTVGLTAGVVLCFECLTKYSADLVIKPFLCLSLAWAFLCVLLAAFEGSALGYMLRLLLYVMACGSLYACGKETAPATMLSDDNAYRGIRVILRDSIKVIATSVLFIGAIGFASGVVRILAMGELSSLHFSMALCLGSVVGITGFYIIYLKYGYPIKFTAVYKALLLVIGLAFCAIPFLLPSYPVILQVIIDTAYLLAGIVMWLSCLVFSRERALPTATVCGLVVGGVYLFVALGATICTVVLSNTAGLFSGNTGIALLLVYGVACVAIVCGYLRPGNAGKGHDDGVVASGGGAVGLHMLTSVSEEELRDSEMLCDAYGITSREMDVLVLLLAGRGVPYIAKSLSVSENTVRTHVKRIYRKLGIHGREELHDLLVEIMKKN